MLITFKTKAAPDITMYQEHATRILDLFKKQAGQGVLTTAELGDAIGKLEAEIADSRIHNASEEVKHDVEMHHNGKGDDNEHEHAEPVSFATRAYPLLEMLRAAHQGGSDVMWGV